MATDAAQSVNRAEQARIYGAPLSEILGHCAAVLDVSRASLAGLLGISAPMLSQLMNARRIKIANPAAAERLRGLVDITARVDAGELSAVRARELLEASAESHVPLTQATARHTRPVSASIQEVFRGVASAGDYLRAAERLEPDYPAVAELLRVFGAEKADIAARYTDARLTR